MFFVIIDLLVLENLFSKALCEITGSLSCFGFEYPELYV